MNLETDSREKIFTYARKLVETNPYVAGCAIAFKEDYFKDRKLFMAYVHHADSAGTAYADTDVVPDDMFADGPYTEQTWFTTPMSSGKAEWLNPLKGIKSDEAPIITFSLPIPDKDGKPIGVIGADVSLSMLSDIISNSKPLDNSYCALLDRDGTYIVHPLRNKLMTQTALLTKEESSRKAAQAMLSGETGYKAFNMDGQEFYIFYKPFKRVAVTGRSSEHLGWSVCIIYSEEEIFGECNSLSFYIWVIVIISLILSFLITGFVIHSQLKPLLMLTKQAQYIAKGHLDEEIPDSRRVDEIGRLQRNFKLMQQSLATNIGELEQLTTELKQHGEELSKAYKQAQKADRIKTAFLHNMTNQMLEPSESICQDVETLCNPDKKGEQKDTSKLANDIQQNGTTIAELLKNLIYMSDEDMRKEVQDA
jgi:methyl-accepting chemotaxis protein